MKALLVGTGGIGRNVYLPQLQAQGFAVTTADLFDPTADYQNPNDAKGKFDVGVVCTPNYSHEQVAKVCLLYTSPSPRDRTRSRMPSSA